MRLAWRRILVGALAAAALAAHVVYWYFPKERIGTPDEDAASGRLYLSGHQEVRLWIPYPHQNLAAARRHVSDPGGLLGAVSRLAGLGAVELPGFGPFVVPPSRALAMAVGTEGSGDLAVAVDVYPLLAVVARLAGTVAGNPLLAGGPVVLSGRRYEVRWEGRAWTLSSAGARASAPTAPLPTRDALAWLTLERARPPLPEGQYRLTRAGRQVVLSSGAPPDGERPALEASAQRFGLAYLEARFGSASRASALLLPSRETRGLELPDAAVVWTTGSDRLDLPGERLARLLGLDLLEERVGRWSVLAIEARSLEAARRLVPELEAYLGGGDLSSLLWLRPGAYRPLAGAIAELLDSLPVASRSDIVFWRDVHTVLAALEDVESVAVETRASGAEARLEWRR